MTEYQIAAEARVKALVREISADKAVKQKYDRPGIYSISLLLEDREIIVYVGKAQNMLKRLGQHIDSMTYNRKSNKYKVLQEARSRGIKVKFDVLIYSAFGPNDQEVWDDLGFKEAAMIRYYMPPLNYQIPKPGDYKHWTVQKSAKYISLNDILMKE